jgi:GT2 family glycosyltransferase
VNVANKDYRLEVLMRGTVILTRYDEVDSLIIPCLISLSKQINVSLTIYFLDQKKDNKVKRICKKLSSKKIMYIYKSIPAKSLSYARNIGIKLAKTSIVMFTDLDAIQDKNWAYELLKTYKVDKKIAVVGGRSIAKWMSKSHWYHKSNIIMEFYSIINLSDKVINTSKVIGVNYSLNKNLLKKLALFREDLGRKNGMLLGGEETDLCKTVIENGYYVYYTPNAIVEHQIYMERSSIFWILKRAYYGGVSRAARGGKPQPMVKRRNIYDFFACMLIAFPYIIGLIYGLTIKNEK